MKILATAIGIFVSLFGLFNISIIADVLFSGGAEKGLRAILYLILLVLFGFLPYLFGAFVCYWGWTRNSQINSEFGGFLQMLFSFERRINRRPFWMMYLYMSGPYMILDLQRNKEIESTVSQVGVVGAMLLFLIFILWPSLAIQVKRWHDIDKSGYWLLLNFIPIIGIVVQIIKCGFEKGTDGPNRYGENPLSPDWQNTLKNVDSFPEAPL